jgi:hypothetical protein
MYAGVHLGNRPTPDPPRQWRARRDGPARRRPGGSPARTRR